MPLLSYSSMLANGFIWLLYGWLTDSALLKKYQHERDAVGNVLLPEILGMQPRCLVESSGHNTTPTAGHYGVPPREHPCGELFAQEEGHKHCWGQDAPAVLYAVLQPVGGAPECCCCAVHRHNSAPVCPPKCRQLRSVVDCRRRHAAGLLRDAPLRDETAVRHGAARVEGGVPGWHLTLGPHVAGLEYPM